MLALASSLEIFPFLVKAFGGAVCTFGDQEELIFLLAKHLLQV